MLVGRSGRVRGSLWACSWVALGVFVGRKFGSWVAVGSQEGSGSCVVVHRVESDGFGRDFGLQRVFGDPCRLKRVVFIPI
jgi:hypothetical protein